MPSHFLKKKQKKNELISFDEKILDDSWKWNKSNTNGSNDNVEFKKQGMALLFFVIFTRSACALQDITGKCVATPHKVPKRVILRAVLWPCQQHTPSESHKWTELFAVTQSLTAFATQRPHQNECLSQRGTQPQPIEVNEFWLLHAVPWPADQKCICDHFHSVEKQNNFHHCTNGLFIYFSDTPKPAECYEKCRPINCSKKKALETCRHDTPSPRNM